MSIIHKIKEDDLIEQYADQWMTLFLQVGYIGGKTRG
jgi:hypothetical protein